MALDNFNEVFYYQSFLLAKLAQISQIFQCIHLMFHMDLVCVSHSFIIQQNFVNSVAVTALLSSFIFTKRDIIFSFQSSSKHFSGNEGITLSYLFDISGTLKAMTERRSNAMDVLFVYIQESWKCSVNEQAC